MLATLTIAPIAHLYLRSNRYRVHVAQQGGSRRRGSLAKYSEQSIENLKKLDLLYLMRGTPSTDQLPINTQEISQYKAEAAEKRAMSDFLDSTERRHRSQLANIQKGTFQHEVLLKLNQVLEGLPTRDSHLSGNGSRYHITPATMAAQGSRASTRTMSVTSNERHSTASARKRASQRKRSSVSTSEVEETNANFPEITENALAMHRRISEGDLDHTSTPEASDDGGGDNEDDMKSARLSGDDDFRSRVLQEMKDLRGRLERLSEMLEPAPVPDASFSKEGREVALASADSPSAKGHTLGKDQRPKGVRFAASNAPAPTQEQSANADEPPPAAAKAQPDAGVCQTPPRSMRSELTVAAGATSNGSEGSVLVSTPLVVETREQEDGTIITKL